jgi:hypothetical protein
MVAVALGGETKVIIQMLLHGRKLVIWLLASCFF